MIPDPDHLEINKFRGIEELKAPNQQVPFTQEMINEYIKCSQDHQYFIKNYVCILNIGTGKIEPMNPRPFQERLFDTVVNNRFVIVCCPRQVGKSTTLAALICWFVNFNENFSVLIAANKAKSAKEIMGRIQTAYRYMPHWIKQGVTKWGVEEFELENGSRVQAIATTKDAGRSGSHQLVVLDEFAFVEPGIADEFYTAILPTISSATNTRLVCLSTPNGLNHFHEMWKLAKEGKSEYVPFEIDWREIPGRDENFKKKMIANLGSVERWEQEFEAKFHGTTNSLIRGSFLETLHTTNIYEKVHGVKIFKKPQKDHVYFMSVDCSEGKGLDYSAFTVIDITKQPFEVVATFRDDEMSHLGYPVLLNNIGKFYNDAYILIELNSTGLEVANLLFNDHEYENILRVSTRPGRGMGQQLGGVGGRRQLGVKTSKTTRSIGASSLKAIIENEQLIINDHDIVKELSNFVMKDGKFQADTGYHDDLVMTLVNFAWATNFNYFKDLTNSNIKDILTQKHLAEIEESMVPFGFIDNGVDDFDDPFS